MNDKLKLALDDLKTLYAYRRQNYGNPNAEPIPHSDINQSLSNQRELQNQDVVSNNQSREWTPLHSRIQQIFRLFSSKDSERDNKQSSPDGVGEIDRLKRQNEEFRRQLSEKDEKIALLKEEVESLSEQGRSAESSHVRTLNLMRIKMRQIAAEMTRLRAENMELKDAIQRELKESIIPQAFNDLQQKLVAYSSKMKNPQEKQKLDSLQLQIFEKYATIAEHTQIQHFSYQDTFEQCSRFNSDLIDYIMTSSFMTQSEIVIDQFTKQWLLATFQRQLRFFGRSSTKLLYRYHENEPNKVNFHLYIDKKPNIFVIVKMNNGAILGGFTVYPFDPESTAKPGIGFLFNLKNQLVFPLKEQPKHPVTAYDGYYISFGNSQLRIKSQQLLLYSNFGMGNGTFDPKSSKLSDFMGTNEREEGIQCYEVHQLIYE